MIVSVEILTDSTFMKIVPSYRIQRRDLGVSKRVPYMGRPALNSSPEIGYPNILFRDFPDSLHVNYGILPKVGHCRFFPIQ